MQEVFAAAVSKNYSAHICHNIYHLNVKNINSDWCKKKCDKNCLCKCFCFFDCFCLNAWTSMVQQPYGIFIKWKIPYGLFVLEYVIC